MVALDKAFAVMQPIGIAPASVRRNGCAGAGVPIPLAVSTRSSLIDRVGGEGGVHDESLRGPGISRMLIGPACRQPVFMSQVFGRQTDSRG
jgi:hypothetical protein